MMRHSGGACSWGEILKGVILQAFRTKEARWGRFLGGSEVEKWVWNRV